MGKYKLGLVSMKLGEIAGDGDMGTSLVQIGDTVTGTAQMETTEATLQDFTIEESSSPIMSIKTDADKITVNWSSYDNSADTLVRLFGGTKVVGVAGGLKTLGTITPGSGYVSGSYWDVPLTGGAGSGAKANIVVAGGVVTSVQISKAGSGYASGTPLSAVNSNLGGSGSGFQVAVTEVGPVGDKWLAPDAVPEIEQSLRVEWKQGGFLEIPRAKITCKLSMQFRKDALSQIDIVATVLQPTKAGIARMVLVNAA